MFQYSIGPLEEPTIVAGLSELVRETLFKDQTIPRQHIHRLSVDDASKRLHMRDSVRKGYTPRPSYGILRRLKIPLPWNIW